MSDSVGGAMNRGGWDGRSSTSAPQGGDRPDTGTSLPRTAILQIGNVGMLRHYQLPREIGAAFLDGRPARVWLLAAEPDRGHFRGEGETALEPTIASPERGSGQSPVQVAPALAEAVHNDAVFCDNPVRAAVWTELPYGTACDDQPRFAVQPLDELLRSDGGLADEVRDATNVANRAVRSDRRAAADAIWHAVPMKELARGVRDRRKEAKAARSAGAAPGSATRPSPSHGKW